MTDKELTVTIFRFLFLSTYICLSLIHIVKDEEYIKAANENYEEAWETLNSTDGWTVVKTDSLGAVIEAKKGNHGKNE